MCHVLCWAPGIIPWETAVSFVLFWLGPDAHSFPSQCFPELDCRNKLLGFITSCMILDKLLNHSVPQFPYLQMNIIVPNL